MILQHLEHFYHPQSYTQTNSRNWLLIHLNGLVQAKVTMPSGKDLGLIDGKKPFALFLPAKGTFSFSYKENRDNWVLMLPKDSLEEKSQEEVCLKMENNYANIPPLHYLTNYQAELCRLSLKKTHLAFHRPGDSRNFLLSLSLNALLDIILNPDLDPGPTDPAESFRQNIVSDRNFTKTLASISDEVGYSSDHLRRLFEERFAISPKKFREQYRMGIALNFLNNGMTAKDVSEELGYNYPGHFSNAFKKFYGDTPSSILQKNYLEESSS